MPNLHSDATRVLIGTEHSAMTVTTPKIYLINLLWIFSGSSWRLQNCSKCISKLKREREYFRIRKSTYFERILLCSIWGVTNVTWNDICLYIYENTVITFVMKILTAGEKTNVGERPTSATLFQHGFASGWALFALGKNKVTTIIDDMTDRRFKI